MSTLIRVELEAKEQLEGLRDGELRVKTHSDALVRLMFDRKMDRKKIEDLQEKARQEKERHEAEDVNLGEKRKFVFSELQAALNLRTLPDLLDLLLEHYHNSPQLDKATFQYYGELMQRAGR
jgi:hypothetical protein